jgi:beta-glucosidase/6-phospho-beta-glucosidase/beta-galactosidase
MGGYECADHINRSGDRVNLLFETEHHTRVLADYKLLEQTGIKTVREGICWSNVEKQPYVYDFSEVKTRLLAAEQTGIQQLWDICHFGLPDDLMPTHPKFHVRFAALCTAFAEVYARHSKQKLIVTPINEISFLSWHAGDVRGTVPFAINSGADIKYHLCRAAIAGIKAFKAIVPDCRILIVEPLIKIHMMPDELHPEDVVKHNNSQYEAMDIIGGRMYPELGGDPSYLDLLGFNYYYNNQWQHNGINLWWPKYLDLHVPLSRLLLTVYERYQRPVLLTETGHFGEGRADWLEFLIPECLEAINLGVDLQGICLYPLIGRRDWDDSNHYHNSGLWDIDNPFKERIVCEPYLNIIQQLQAFINQEQVINI